MNDHTPALTDDQGRIVNHDEARELALATQNESNLARCYLALLAAAPAAPAAQAASKETCEFLNLADAVVKDAQPAAPQKQEPVAYLIDWPDEPELGHYFAEEDSNTGRSRPLYLAPPAPSAGETK